MTTHVKRGSALGLFVITETIERETEVTLHPADMDLIKRTMNNNHLDYTQSMVNLIRWVRQRYDTGLLASKKIVECIAGQKLNPDDNDILQGDDSCSSKQER